MVRKIEDWIKMAESRIIECNEMQDIHLDELFDNISENKEDVLSFAIEIARTIKKDLIHSIRHDLKLYIFVLLESESNQLIGVPKNFKSLIDRMDPYYCPEIVLYKPFDEETYGQTEFYRSVLPFEIPNADSLNFLYREGRSLDDLINEEDFTRELDIIIK